MGLLGSRQANSGSGVRVFVTGVRGLVGVRSAPALPVPFAGFNPITVAPYTVIA